MINIVNKVIKMLLVFAIFLPLTLYFILLIVNFSDEEKSAQVLTFEKFLSQRNSFDERQNAYISLIGITAKPDEDIYIIGLQRIEQLRKHRAIDNKLPFTDFFNINDINVQLTGMFSACEQSMPLNDKCQQSLFDQQEQITILLKQNQLLLQRYRKLTKLVQWQEILPLSNHYDSGMRYQLLLALQKLNMLAIWQMTVKNNTAEVSSLLEQQGQFNRNILSSTHALLTKMIMFSAIEQYYHWLDIILMHGDNSVSTTILAGSLNTPLTMQELSFEWPLIGEWQFSQSIFSDMTQEINSEYPWVNVFVLPLFKLQDTLNLQAKLLAETFKPLVKTNMKNTNKQGCAVGNTWQTLRWYSYNPVGKLMACASDPNMSLYQKNLNGLELLRASVVSDLIR
jgi:hypothetical protein